MRDFMAQRIERKKGHMTVDRYEDSKSIYAPSIFIQPTIHPCILLKLFFYIF